MHQYAFEKLDSYRELRTLVKMIYTATQSFPSTEIFGLTNQLRRAAVSTVSNLAEGSARLSKKDQGHFYNIAYSSLLEILAQVILSNDLGFLSADTLIELREQIEICTRLLNSLRKSAMV